MKTPPHRFPGTPDSPGHLPEPADATLDLAQGRIAARRLPGRRNSREGGTGIVFLHEALGCNAMWKGWPQRLSAHTGLPGLSYDRYGHGRSDPLPRARTPDYLEYEAWDVLPQVLEACGVTDPILYGHSDGGTIALMYASRFPARAVITEAAHVFVEEVTRAGIRDALDAWRSTDLPERLARYHGDKTEALFFAWADTWLSDEFASWNVEACLPGITCPVLAVQGEDDEYGTAAQVEAIVKGVSGNARRLMLPDCRHIPYLQADDRLLPLASAFIADCLG